jgi:hypothetical protein
MNKDHLSTTATILLSQGCSSTQVWLYTNYNITKTKQQTPFFDHNITEHVNNNFIFEDITETANNTDIDIDTQF